MPNDKQPVSEAARAALRALPRIDDLLASPQITAAGQGAPHTLVVSSLRASLDAERARIMAGEEPLGTDALMDACVRAVQRDMLPNLRCAVNATGVVIHTNLGRAPMSGAAAAHVADVAAHYDTLEFDVETCKRGSRHDHVAGLLCQVTGAEDAAVVNNNAAAVMLVLSEFARGREAIVSRGELIEIGGSFRVPDIMELSGARMVEVGTTNKTHLADFERALTPDTALVLKVHPSNYRVVGFHEEVSAAELTRLAHEHGVMVYEDQGSGVLVNLEEAGIATDEHTPGWSLAQGVDVVTCSGDKLLGASQAGIILGSHEIVSRIKKNPLMRALRPDKLTLAGLEATLRAYLDIDKAWEQVPVLAMLRKSGEELRASAEDVFARTKARVSELLPALVWDACLQPEEDAAPAAHLGGLCLRVGSDVSFVGGGALPTLELPSWTVRVSAPHLNLDESRTRLIQEVERPVVTRVSVGELVADVRTLVDERDRDDLVEALAGEIVALVKSASKEGRA